MPQSSVATGKNAAANPTDPVAAPSKRRLLIKMLAAFCLILIVYGGILFIPAGTLSFWQAWVYLAVLIVPTFSGYCYIYRVDPELLERRMRQKEQVREQKLLMRWVKPLFLVFFMVPGLDYRFAWSKTLLGGVPLWLTVLSDAIALAALLSVMWCFRFNRFAGRTIQVEAEQKVISTGPYRFVRHPMYAASAVLMLFTPLALGSWIAMPAVALWAPFYAVRILSEEKVLREQLPGYAEYCLRTRYRMIPFVW